MRGQIPREAPGLLYIEPTYLPTPRPTSTLALSFSYYKTSASSSPQDPFRSKIKSIPSALQQPTVTALSIKTTYIRHCAATSPHHIRSTLVACQPNCISTYPAVQLHPQTPTDVRPNTTASRTQDSITNLYIVVGLPNLVLERHSVPATKSRTKHPTPCVDAPHLCHNRPSCSTHLSTQRSETPSYRLHPHLGLYINKSTVAHSHNPGPRKTVQSCFLDCDLEKQTGH